MRNSSRSIVSMTQSASSSGSIIPSMLATPSSRPEVIAVRTACGQSTETRTPRSP